MVLGVSYDKTSDSWKVCSLKQWGVKQQLLKSAKSREEAEAVAETYSPRLKAAAADGTFDEASAEAKAELKAQVWFS